MTTVNTAKNKMTALAATARTARPGKKKKKRRAKDSLDALKPSRLTKKQVEQLAAFTNPAALLRALLDAGWSMTGSMNELVDIARGGSSDTVRLAAIKYLNQLLIDAMDRAGLLVMATRKITDEEGGEVKFVGHLVSQQLSSVTLHQPETTPEELQGEEWYRNHSPKPESVKRKKRRDAARQRAAETESEARGESNDANQAPETTETPETTEATDSPETQDHGDAGSAGNSDSFALCRPPNYSSKSTEERHFPGIAVEEDPESEFA